MSWQRKGLGEEEGDQKSMSITEGRGWGEGCDKPKEFMQNEREQKKEMKWGIEKKERNEGEEKLKSEYLVVGGGRRREFEKGLWNYFSRMLVSLKYLFSAVN